MSWIDSHRRVDKGVTVSNCRMECLLFADELVAYCMRGSWSWTGSKLAFDRISAACDQEGTKISSTKIEVLCLLRRPRQCSASERKYTTAGGDVQVLWGGIHEWRKSEQRAWYTDDGYVKQRQFCVSFIAPWRRNGSFRRTQSFQVLNRSLFRFSPMFINIRWRLKKCCQRNKLQRWDICEVV